MIPEAKRKGIEGEGLKILTTKQMKSDKLFIDCINQAKLLKKYIIA